MNKNNKKNTKYTHNIQSQFSSRLQSVQQEIQDEAKDNLNHFYCKRQAHVSCYTNALYFLNDSNYKRNILIILVDFFERVGRSLQDVYQRIEQYLLYFLNEHKAYFRVPIIEWRQLGESCHARCKKTYKHFKNSKILAMCSYHLSDIFDAVPNANQGFELEKGYLVPAEYTVQVPMGLYQVMHNVRLSWNLICTFYYLHTGVHQNCKVWMEHYWLSYHETYFCKWVNKMIEKQIPPESTKNDKDDQNDIKDPK